MTKNKVETNVVEWCFKFIESNYTFMRCGEAWIENRRMIEKMYIEDKITVSEYGFLHGYNSGIHAEKEAHF